MNEVVAELDGSDLEDSEDNFDGYLNWTWKVIRRST